MYSRKAIAWSVALHVMVALVLIVSVDFSPNEIRQPASSQEIVEATVVDGAAVQREMERLKAADAQKKAAQVAQAKALEDKRKAEEQRVKELKAEQERLKRAEAEAQQKKKVAEEQAKEAKRKQAEAERQRKTEEAKRAQAEAERKKAEEVAEREAAAAAEQKRAAEELRKKQEAAAREAERKRIEQALQDELAAEEAAQQAAAQAQADAREIDKYVAAIATRVRQSYTILPGLEGLSCILRIRLIPGGDVAGVEIVKSSGNATFDRQAETAVRKASPLPVPSDPKLFQQMRSIQFVFDPQH